MCRGEREREGGEGGEGCLLLCAMHCMLCLRIRKYIHTQGFRIYHTHAHTHTHCLCAPLVAFVCVFVCVCVCASLVASCPRHMKPLWNSLQKGPCVQESCCRRNELHKGSHLGAHHLGMNCIRDHVCKKKIKLTADEPEQNRDPVLVFSITLTQKRVRTAKALPVPHHLG